ncbi:MAG: acyl carrier protein [Desulfatibacillaceae bacterium]
MEVKEAYNLVHHYLVNEFEIPEAEIHMDADMFSDLELDSIDVLDMLAFVESELGWTVDEDAMANMRAIRDIVHYLAENFEPPEK